MINTISDLFGRSPIKPIQQHMASSVAAAALLPDYFKAGRAGDWEQAKSVYDEITKLEHKADELKVEIRLHLPKSLFLPVPRQDLLELLTVQDKVANTARDIAGLMLGRKMCFPETLQDAVDAYVASAVATANAALKAVNELDELLEFGFKGKELGIVESLVSELNAQEHIADEHERSLRSALFAVETELPPVEVMFLYRVIEQIGALADRAERVGSRLLLLVAR
ncbi:TIGR00153 family protein [Agaribacterium sp. ZY112]|uniref:TIGR00153 family protein n=1 Tax=Agaribacterium sp. ZY112 TaxID=3233574 RepID=UPI003523D65F